MDFSRVCQRGTEGGDVTDVAVDPQGLGLPDREGDKVRGEDVIWF